MPMVLYMPKFWIWQCSESGKVLDIQALHSVLNMLEYALLDGVQNIPRILNMPVFLKWISYTGC